MTHESPQVPQKEAIHPRTGENYPRPGLFKVDAMPDDYIAMIGRALDREQVRMGREREVDGDVAVSELMAHLGADIAQIVTTNPERGRALMSRLAQSDNVHERNVAASAAVPLGFRGDYEFARDTLLGIYERDHYDTTAAVDLSGAYIEELDEILTPIRPDLAGDLQQRSADLHRRLFGYGPDEPI